MHFAKEAWPFVLPPAIGALVLTALGAVIGGSLLALLATLLLLFFRIPNRESGADDSVILAPANGRILSLETVEDPTVGAGTFHRIVTFLSVFDVHVQRAPTAGDVVVSHYSPGRRVPAFRSDAGEVNQQHLTVLQRENGDLVGIRQVAGLLARRVVAYRQSGDSVRRGDLLGLIKFGSRVDLLIPVSYHLEVRVGQRLREGDTPMARIEEAP